MRLKLVYKLKKLKRLYNKSVVAALLGVAALPCSMANATVVKADHNFSKKTFNVTVTGKVLDDTNQPLPGVSVKDAKWLTFAQNNIDALNKAARNKDTHAYYYFSGFAGDNRSPEIEGVDQAWMQRIQAMISKYK